MDLFRNDIFSLHETQELSWDLLQYFFRQKSWVIFEFREWNELDDIGGHIFFEFLGVKGLVVSVEDIH